MVVFDEHLVAQPAAQVGAGLPYPVPAPFMLHESQRLLHLLPQGYLEVDLPVHPRPRNPQVRVIKSVVLAQSDGGFHHDTRIQHEDSVLKVRPDMPAPAHVDLDSLHAGQPFSSIRAPASLSAYLWSSLTVSPVSPAPRITIDPTIPITLRAKLENTPPSGRSAVVLAALPQLAVDASDASSALLYDLVSSRFDGVSRDSIAEYVRVAPAIVSIRAFRRSPARWSFNLSVLLSRFAPPDVLEDLAEVRDRRRTALEYLYTTGLVHLAFTVASGDLNNTAEPLHRKHGDETLLLLGASPHPELLLRELISVNYLPGPTPAYDLGVSRWCMENPGHSTRSRAYAASLLAAPTLAALCADGVCTIADVRSWLTIRRTAAFDPQIQLALTMHDLPGAARLRSRLFALLPDVATYIFALSPADRTRVLDEFYPGLTSLALEYIELLSPKWSHSFPDLVATASRLARNSSR
jgi:hypothetical protein